MNLDWFIQVTGGAAGAAQPFLGNVQFNTRGRGCIGARHPNKLLGFKDLVFLSRAFVRP